MDRATALSGFLTKMKSHTHLSTDDEQALCQLPFRIVDASAAQYIVREGEQPGPCAILVEGFAIRQKLVENGARQILGIQVPGDAVDLQQLFLMCADHNIQTLTNVTMAMVPRAALRSLAMERPRLALAFGISNQIEASIYREWLLNIGRRSAAKRIAHLLCEMAVRLETNDAAGDRYQLPLTQEQMGDALGLTAVHTNRTLRDLGESGLIDRKLRAIVIPDFDALRRFAEFDPLYLHIGPQYLPDLSEP